MWLDMEVYLFVDLCYSNHYKFKKKAVSMIPELKTRIKELNDRLEILRGYL
jgi:hypothetical protein